MTNEIAIYGDAGCPGGVYLLRLTVARSLRLAFGRFRGGEPIAVPPGDCLYVGSARGRRGANALAGRLLRHATRAAGPPQAIRDELAARLAAAGLIAPLPAHKTLRWHVDYLLEQSGLALTGVLALRAAQPLETALADWLLARPGVVPLAPGLGASDDRGRTHLLRVIQKEETADYADFAD